MKKVFLILSVTCIFASCKKENNQIEPKVELIQPTKPIPIIPTPPVVPNEYLFDGTINGVLFQTDSVIISGNFITFGDGVPTIMIALDTLYQGAYSGFNGFSGCINTHVVNPSTQGVLSWCNVSNLIPNNPGDLNILHLNDSIISGELNMVLSSSHFQDVNGNLKDSTINIIGQINSLDLKQ